MNSPTALECLEKDVQRYNHFIHCKESHIEFLKELLPQERDELQTLKEGQQKSEDTLVQYLLGGDQ